MKIIKKLFTKKPITTRQTYIKMLSDRVSSVDSASPEQRVHFLWSELISSDYLKGVTKFNPIGIPTGNVIGSPTVKGRLFLQELLEKEAKESATAKIKTCLMLMFSYAGGIASVVFSDYLKKLFIP